jgi:hypothetical protein
MGSFLICVARAIQSHILPAEKSACASWISARETVVVAVHVRPLIKVAVIQRVVIKAAAVFIQIIPNLLNIFIWVLYYEKANIWDSQDIVEIDGKNCKI